MFRRTHVAALCIAAFALSTTACSEKWTSGSSSGADSSAPTAADLAKLTGFSAVELTGPDNVVVTVGKPFAISIKADPDVAKMLEIKVVNGVLRVGRRSDMGSLWNGNEKEATINVSLPSIRAASLTGSGDMTIDTIETKDLALDLTGSGDIAVEQIAVASLSIDTTGSGDVSLAGTAGSAKLSTTGSGDIDAEGLKVDSATASLLGSGNIDFASDGKVDIKIMGSGDVGVAGKAQCHVQAMGPGEAHCAA